MATTPSWFRKALAPRPAFLTPNSSRWRRAWMCRRRLRPVRYRAQGARPEPSELPLLRRGSILVGLLSPHEDLSALAATGVTAFAMERLPRITRAQSMDVLSSQANIAGYKAVIVGAHEYGRFMPMLMTAAGTVKAARVLVLGAGVAGLQAIATAKRLGAVIEAFDVRPDVKEQVESLGREVRRGRPLG